MVDKEKNYWMLVSTPDNFEISRGMGFTVQGIKSRHRKKAEGMKAGDRVLYYLTGQMAFSGTATITSTYWEDHQPIWRSEKEGEDYPFRFHVNPDVILEKGEFIAAQYLIPHIDYVRKWPVEHWHLAFQGNVHLLSEKDFNFIEGELKKVATGRSGRVDPSGSSSRSGRIDGEATSGSSSSSRQSEGT